MIDAPKPTQAHGPWRASPAASAHASGGPSDCRCCSRPRAAAQLPDPLAMLVGGACVMMCTSMSHVLKHAFACCCADGDICLIERALHHSRFDLTADFKLCASSAQASVQSIQKRGCRSTQMTADGALHPSCSRCLEAALRFLALLLRAVCRDRGDSAQS
jgi:hypothetical protein